MGNVCASEAQEGERQVQQEMLQETAPGQTQSYGENLVLSSLSLEGPEVASLFQVTEGPYW